MSDLIEFLRAREDDRVYQRFLNELCGVGLPPGRLLQIIDRGGYNEWKRSLAGASAQFAAAVRVLGWALLDALPFTRGRVRMEAARYAEHPDYRPEWKPDTPGTPAP